MMSLGLNEILSTSKLYERVHIATLSLVEVAYVVDQVYTYILAVIHSTRTHTHRLCIQHFVYKIKLWMLKKRLKS